MNPKKLTGRQRRRLISSKTSFSFIIKLAFMILPLLVSGLTYAQNVAINADGSLPNKNAILDIKSDNKGLLIPRMTTDARLKISNTQGLMVYDINTNSFWYNTGRAWQNLTAPLNSIDARIADSAWALLGNAGTDENIHFLGTTDNATLNIRVNNQKSGRIDHILANTFWGFRSGFLISTGNDNTGLGSHALFHNTTGFNNTGVGSSALQTNSTGFHNSAFGRMALLSNTTGFNNTSSGASSLFSNTIGRNNTASGVAAMFFNTGGFENTANGAEALFSNSTGFLNVAVGYQSMRANTTAFRNTAVGHTSLTNNNTGNQNTAIGNQALVNNTTGNNNTAIGFNALFANTSGSSNTAIGSSANVSTGSLTNATALGNGAIVNASNKVRIGNAAVTVIEGQVPFTFPSDGRFKFAVQEDIKGLDFIMQLRPVTYNFDTKRFDAQFGEGSTTEMDAAYDAASKIRRSGFIAQEVQQAARKTGYDFSGIITPNKDQQHYSLSYDAFVVPLVKAVQEQQQVINDQQKSIQEQNKKIAGLQKELDEIKTLLKSLR